GSRTHSPLHDRGVTIDELVADTHHPTPDIQGEDTDQVRRLQHLLHEIDAPSATFLKLRYGLEGEDPMTLKEIGLRIGLPRERVRQIEHEALARLKEAMMAGIE